MVLGLLLKRARSFKVHETETNRRTVKGVASQRPPNAASLLVGWLTLGGSAEADQHESCRCRRVACLVCRSGVRLAVFRTLGCKVNDKMVAMLVWRFGGLGVSAKGRKK